MTIPIKRKLAGLGEFEETDKISIEHGGTNANSLLEAQDNLGISTKAEQADLTNLLNDVVDLTEEVATKADAAAVNQALSTKADLVDGVIPAAQLPSFVDDVLNGTYIDDETFNDENDDPYTPESGKIYVDTTTNKTYRWSGSIYVEIGGGGVALGETSSTAYRGDRGKEAYDHSLSQGNPHNTTTSEITEGTRKYFTEQRVLDSLLTGLSVPSASGPITSDDSILAALSKIQSQLNINWVNATTVATINASILTNTFKFARYNGMLWVQGAFTHTENIASGSALITINDSSYFVKKEHSSAQVVSIGFISWGATGQANSRFQITGSSSETQQIFSSATLSGLATEKQLPVWCIGELLNP
ncbi:hypothetical protein DX910_00475 [Acinetobacter haemolyticus]|nr:hypothetical protein DX910_00475 [Acinetobacter haemolyticus]